ncbi:MAG: SDR family oxidoreductase [Paenibacillaceae bacterium]|nr:SDR family oxidoreductase [Paenibacillaceae bacterium]
MRLRDKTAFITGSTRGIGREIADVFAREGATVGIHGRQEADVAAVVNDIRASGGSAFGIAADLADPEAPDAVHTQLSRLCGGVDLLVNNAGMSIPEPYGSVSRATFDAQLHVNFVSAFRLTQLLTPQMAARGQGAIVNISTCGTMQAHHNKIVYDSVKGALEAFTRSLAVELAASGIRANAIRPGAIANSPDYETDTPANNARRDIIPMKRMGTNREIAEVVLFLCLPESGYVTGQIFDVDGGRGVSLPILNPVGII